MLSPNKSEEFLEEVLSYIKFYPDRAHIRSELECHIADKREYYIDQGYTKESAEGIAVKDMGDAKEIGIKLNKLHNPFLGWIWKITNVMVILFMLSTLYNIGSSVVHTISQGNPINEIPKSEIVYKLDIDERVKLDDMIIRFTNIIFEENGNMNIFYEYYDTKLWGTGWTLGSIGEIRDNLGNEYLTGGWGENGGIKSKGTYTVEDFSKEADTLIIDYDNYNRKYRVEIPLRMGDHHE